jgi:hypothetical protein
MQALWMFLLPSLRQFPAGVRWQAVEAARQTPLDAIELLAMALATAVVTWLTRYSWPLEGSVLSRVLAMAINFAIAVPLLALAFGPLHVRRLRRGLREFLRRRAAG